MIGHSQAELYQRDLRVLSGAPPTLSVVVISWNTRELLKNCLESIERSTHTWEGASLETYVVDNASSDLSANMVHDDFPWVQLIKNPENVGFARANNQALRASHGKYVMLLNSDTEVLPNALETMIQFMDAHPRAGACGPQLLNGDDSLQTSCYPMLTPAREFWRLIFLEPLWHRATYAQKRLNQNDPRPVDVIKGACFLLRQDALDEVGLLDEQYFMYTEEVDLCYRLAKAGWRIWWTPQAKVKHYGEASSRQMAEAMYIQLYRSKIQFCRKFGGTRRATHFKRLLWLAYVPRLIVATVGSSFSRTMARRAQTFRRLLKELPAM